MNCFKLIKKRRSVRAFDGNPLSKEDAAGIMEFAGKVENPYDIPIEWKLLDANKDSLSSPVITGTDTFIAGKMRKMPHAEETFGYSFEKVVLYAMSLGIGTTWIAGTMDREAFERAMHLKEGEVMPCISPLGYPAKKMSLRETLMRKGIKADSRLPFEELFFDGSFEKQLSREKAGKLEPLFEGVRLGPSAVNRQPWRLVLADNKVHFYKKSAKIMGTPDWDIQKIDIGIALAHFELMAEECGIPVCFCVEEPDMNKDETLTYIATFCIEECECCCGRKGC